MPGGLTARALVAGAALGEVVRLAPLSFWGGFDPATGTGTPKARPTDTGTTVRTRSRHW